MSLDGFTAGPGDAMGWIFDYMRAEQFPEIMAATGAMLCGRRTYEVGKRLAGESGNEPAYDGGPEFVLTHELHIAPGESRCSAVSEPPCRWRVSRASAAGW